MMKEVSGRRTSRRGCPRGVEDGIVIWAGRRFGGSYALEARATMRARAIEVFVNMVVSPV
jgi:hypothetical protein